MSSTASARTIFGQQHVVDIELNYESMSADPTPVVVGTVHGPRDGGAWKIAITDAGTNRTWETELDPAGRFKSLYYVCSKPAQFFETRHGPGWTHR